MNRMYQSITRNQLRKFRKATLGKTHRFEIINPTQKEIATLALNAVIEVKYKNGFKYYGRITGVSTVEGFGVKGNYLQYIWYFKVTRIDHKDHIRSPKRGKYV